MCTKLVDGIKCNSYNIYCLTELIFILLGISYIIKSKFQVLLVLN